MRKEGNPESGAGIKLVTFHIYQLESYDFTKSKSTTLEVQFRLGNCNFYPFFCLIMTFSSIPYLLVAVQQL